MRERRRTSRNQALKEGWLPEAAFSLSFACCQAHAAVESERRWDTMAIATSGTECTMRTLIDSRLRRWEVSEIALLQLYGCRRQLLIEPIRLKLARRTCFDNVDKFVAVAMPFRPNHTTQPVWLAAQPDKCSRRESWVLSRSGAPRFS